MASLKNIIFDLGGVLLDIDYKKTEDAFVDLGYDNFHEMYSQFSADELFRKLETGKISDDDFYAVLVNAHARSVTADRVRSAWNAMLLGWRGKSLDFLESMPDYKIYLLSNTNTIHSTEFHRTLKEETGRHSIDPLFSKAYWSHKIKMRKPDAEIFQFLAADAGIIPAETLLVDDSRNNIEAASALGFKTHLLRAGESVEKLNYSGF